MKKLAVFYIFFFCLSCQLLMAKSEMRATYLRTEYKINPFVDQLAPRLSWELTAVGYNQTQTAFQIVVSSSKEKLEQNIGDLWDSKKRLSNRSNQIKYEGTLLQEGQQVWWKVRVWNQDGQVGPWSEKATWEIAKLSKAAWQAKWIGKDLNQMVKRNGEYLLPPSPYLRKEAQIKKKLKHARLYISSLGLHNFYINGEKIGNDFFGSGWTDYNKRVYYQVYDVTAQLHKGANAFSATLANGWYAGYLGYALLVGSSQVNQFYGKFPLLKAQIDLTFTDGTKETIVTDKSWKWNLGAIEEADLLQGEYYNAGKLLKGWNIADFNDTSWAHVDEIMDKDNQALELYPSEPVRVVKELPVKSIQRIEGGKYIVDFGQNFAGIIRLKQQGKKGDSLVFKYGEMLFPDGQLMTDNLRKARATDTYVFRGDGTLEAWNPSFTYHGFQYVEVTGLKEEPQADFLTGLVLSSDLHEVGDFRTDNDLLNKLYSNIVWTQRANYVDIPTDCPQRDERLGWTGDAQVYMRSAAFNYDIAAFHQKWIQDLNDAQFDNGAFPIYAPMPKNNKGIAAIRGADYFSPGWSEAGVICTYEIFKAYDDHEIVRKSLPYMLHYMEFLKNRTVNHIFPEGAFADIEPKGGFGDWLSVGEKTSPDLLATLYYFYCNKLLYEMCQKVGDLAYAEAFHLEMGLVRQNFIKHYLTLEDGHLHINTAAYGTGEGYVEGGNGFSGHTQTAYANTIYVGILPNELEAKAGKHLRDLVVENGNQLTTGFLGFKPLLPALSKTNSSDKAYGILLSEQYPSLGYEIINGATSIWERWDSYIKGKGFIHNAAMNSFSHYAFGSVNEWIFENLLGIKSLEPGFKKIQIKPEIDGKEIRHAEGTYRSIMGKICSAWHLDGINLRQKVEVPVNVTALCYIKTKKLKNVSVNGKPLTKEFISKYVTQTDGYFVLNLGSGNYEIRSKMER